MDVVLDLHGLDLNVRGFLVLSLSLIVLSSQFVLIECIFVTQALNQFTLLDGKTSDQLVFLLD